MCECDGFLSAVHEWVLCVSAVGPYLGVVRECDGFLSVVCECGGWMSCWINEG